MSGSDSSARGSAGAPDSIAPLGLTVHSMPSPQLTDEARRTASGRLKMLLVLLVCAAPVLASYFTYFVIRPEGRTNYGELIQPSRPLPDLAFTDLDGRPVAAATLKGQWLLVVVGPSSCDTACQSRLFMQRQLREMTGAERDRIDKVWLVDDDGRPSEALLAAVSAAPAVTALRADRAALARWLQPEPGHALEDHLYIVDPLGNWMMRAPAQPDPVKLKKDLERLLRASSSWDHPGR